MAAVHRLEGELLPGWLRPTRGENRVSVAVAILIAVVLQFLLPHRFTLVRPTLAVAAA